MPIKTGNWCVRAQHAGCHALLKFIDLMTLLSGSTRTCGGGEGHDYAYWTLDVYYLRYAVQVPPTSTKSTQ